MKRINGIALSIIAFFYIGALTGCTSLSINMRGNPRDERPGVQNAASATVASRAGQTLSAADHIQSVVVVVGFLNKPPDADKQENSPKPTGALREEHFASAAYYGTVKDPRAQGNRPIKTGVGFIIEAANNWAIVLTNSHVAKNTDNLTVVLYNGEVYSAYILWAGGNSDPDIAFLEIKKRDPADPREIFTAAKLGDSDTTAAGDRYLMIGHPYSLFYSAHTGTLAQTRHSLFTQEDTILQMNMNVYPGNSGSPLFNEQGEVDGVVFAVKVDTNNNWLTAIGWAIPINPIKQKFQEIKQKMQ